MSRLFVALTVVLLVACGGGSSESAPEVRLESVGSSLESSTTATASSSTGTITPIVDTIATSSADVNEHVSPVIEVDDSVCVPEVVAGVTNVEVQRSDGTRSYVVHRPNVTDGRLPLLVDLHGTTGTSDLQEATSGLGSAGIESGAWITVTPQAIGPVSAWSVPGAVPGDDLDFIEEIVVDLVNRACADPDRVFAAGFSSGAAMATWLGCESTLFAGVAPVAGVNLARICEDAPPVSLLAFHGTGDTIVPMEGLEGWESDRFDDLRLFYRGDAWVTVESWARRNGCESEPTAVELSPSSTRYEWSACAAGSMVVFVVTEGAGHVWPVEASAEIRARFLDSP